MVPSFLKSAEDRGWKVERLEHLIANKVIVGHLDGNHGSLYPRSSEFIDSGIKYISANALINGKVDLTKAKFLSIERGSQFKKGVAKSGDVLFAHNATVGPVGILETTDEFVIISTSLTYYRCNPSKIDNVYLSQFMASPSLIRQYERIMKQTTRNQIPITAQRDFYFVLPPLPEQQKIAKILSTWDKAISTTERLIGNSTQQKKALMQQLLTGKQRLLDESGQRFAGEWEEYKLGEITDFIRDGTHGTHKRYESGVPMLSAKNITKENTVDFDDAPYISEEDYNKIHARYTIKSGDILLTVVGTLGRVALVPEELAEKFTLQRSVAIIRVAKGVCNQFLMQLFSSSDFTHLLHRKSNSTAQAGVYLGELGKLKILLPSFEEQQKIATVLTNADKEIELLEQQLADLQQEKKALMQVLLTGKVRVLVNGG